jgi:hypothetical protein
MFRRLPISSIAPRLSRGVHVEKKLEELGIVLPPVNPPVANYRLCTRVGNMLFTGKLCFGHLLRLPHRSLRLPAFPRNSIVWL